MKLILRDLFGTRQVVMTGKEANNYFDKHNENRLKRSKLLFELLRKLATSLLISGIIIFSLLSLLAFIDWDNDGTTKTLAGICIK